MLEEWAVGVGSRPPAAGRIALSPVEAGHCTLAVLRGRPRSSGRCRSPVRGRRNQGYGSADNESDVPEVELVQQTPDRLRIVLRSYGATCALVLLALTVAAMSRLTDTDAMGDGNVGAMRLAAAGLLGLALIAGSTSRLEFDRSTCEAIQRRHGLIPLLPILNRKRAVRLTAQTEVGIVERQPSDRHRSHLVVRDPHKDRRVTLNVSRLGTSGAHDLANRIRAWLSTVE